MQIHTLKGLSGLEEDCLIYVKECGRSVQSSAGMLRIRRPRKNNIQVKRRKWGGWARTRAAAGNEAFIWAVADLHVSQQDKLKEKGKKCFLWTPLTQNQGKIHPRITIAVSAQLNQQRRSVSRLCASCSLINLPLCRRETGGRLSGENDTI